MNIKDIINTDEVGPPSDNNNAINYSCTLGTYLSLNQVMQALADSRVKIDYEMKIPKLQQCVHEYFSQINSQITNTDYQIVQSLKGYSSSEQSKGFQKVKDDTIADYAHSVSICLVYLVQISKTSMVATSYGSLFDMQFTLLTVHEAIGFLLKEPSGMNLTIKTLIAISVLNNPLHSMLSYQRVTKLVAAFKFGFRGYTLMEYLGKSFNWTSWLNTLNNHGFKHGNSFVYLTDLKAMVMAIQSNSPKIINAEWLRNEKGLLDLNYTKIMDKVIGKKEFGLLYDETIEEVRDILLQSGWELKKYDFNTIRDDSSNVTYGYSIFQDRLNFAIWRFYRSPTLKLEVLQTVLEKLRFLIHIAGGNPPRAAGWNLGFSNNKNHIRNVYVKFGTLLIYTENRKVSWQSTGGIADSMLHFLPVDLSVLIVNVAEYQNKIQGTLIDGLFQNDGQPWSDSKIRSSINSTLGKVGLSLQTYRQYASFLVKTAKEFLNLVVVDQSMTRQGGHTIRTATKYYAGTQTEFMGVEITSYFQCSQTWQTYFGFSSNLVVGYQAIQVVPPLSYRELVNTTLIDMFGKDSKFKNPMIEQAIVSFLKSPKDIIVSTETGSGKSLIPVIISKITRKIVVYLPMFKVLESQACNYDYIKAGMFEPEKENDYDLVVVSPSQLIRTEFQSFLNLKMDSIAALVIDEIHEISQSCYRSNLQSLWTGFTFKIPIIGLSATFLKNDLQTLNALFNMDFQLMKNIMPRPNLEYCCTEVNIDTLPKHVVEKVSNHQRSIVYCKSKKMLNFIWCNFEIRNLTSYIYYRTGEGDNIKLEEGLHKWLKEGGIMIATSCLGYGIDSIVDCVVYVEKPYTISALDQAWGRAGRDGNMASCSLFVYKSDVIVGCIRNFLSNGLEYGSLECNMLGESFVKCSNCQSMPFIKPLERVYRTVLKEEKQSLAELEMLLKIFLENYSTGCILCLLTTGKSGSHFGECPSFRGRCFKCAGRHSLCECTKVKFKMGAGFCFNCGLLALKPYHEVCPKGKNCDARWQEGFKHYAMISILEKDDNDDEYQRLGQSVSTSMNNIMKICANRLAQLKTTVTN